MSPGSVHRDWLRFVLEADGISDYREVPAHHHRVDWLGRGISFVSLAIVGFAVAAAYMGIAASRPAVTAERSQLLERVRHAQLLTDDAVARYQQARASYAATQDAVRPDLNGELATSMDIQSTVAGYTELRGPGLVLVLNDSEQPSYSGTTDLGKLIDRDVQHAVNALWQSGAEAVTVNGIRLTSRTSIRNAGSSILVGYQPASRPITVRALGNAAMLKRNLKGTSEWDELGLLRDRYGIRWSLTARRSMQLGAASSSMPTLAQIGDGS